MANSLIPFSQRRNLHFKLAEALEASHTIPPVPAAIIGFHLLSPASTWRGTSGGEP